MLSNVIDLERVSHGVKTALACLIGFGLMRFFPFEINQWLIITIIVVMSAQLSVGSVIQKSYMRFLGTLSGSVIALLTIVFFKNDEWAYGAVIAVSTMIFSYIATGEKGYAESGTLGAVTVVIILIGQNPTLRSAIERFLEISLGILIAALVSQFVLPIHASRHLRDLQAKTIRQLRSFYLVNQMTSLGVEHDESYQKLEEDIANLLIQQRKLSKEAAREPIGEEFKTIRFQQWLRVERGILRSITIMHYIIQRFYDMNEIFSDKSVLSDFQQSISMLLEKIALGIEKGSKEKIKLALPDTTRLKNYVFKIEKNLSDENVEYINAYLFSVEMLVDHVTVLVELFNDS